MGIPKYRGVIFTMYTLSHYLDRLIYLRFGVSIYRCIGLVEQFSGQGLLTIRVLQGRAVILPAHPHHLVIPRETLSIQSRRQPRRNECER